MKLNHRGAAGLHGAVTRCAQQPDRLNDPVGLLRDRLGLAGQEQPGGHLRVDRVALADTTAGVRVRLVDLDDPDPVLAQVAHQRSRILNSSYSTATTSSSPKPLSHSSNSR